MLAGLLLASVVALSAQPIVLAQTLTGSSSTTVRGQVSIGRDVNVVTGNEKISLNMRDASLRDVLNILAQQGHFNLIMDESVTGTLTVDIKNISINKALEYVFTIANLSYTRDGNTVMVASKAKADEKNLSARTFKAIPVLYKNAANIATQLNNTIFKVPRPGGSTSALAASDPDSNSLLVMGTDADIKLVGDTLRELDVPRNRKVYSIRHNSPSYVAQVLAANFFTSTLSSSSSGGGASASTGGGGGGTATTGDNSGGSSTSAGSTATSGGSSSSSSGSGGSSGSTGSSSTAGSSGTLSAFTAGGVTFIPEPVSATLTVLATEEQLALIDGIIDQVDVMRPQVAVEVSLVEIQNSTLKSLVPDWSTFSIGRIAQINPFNNGTESSLLNFRNPFANTGVQFNKPTTVVQGMSFSHKNQNLRGKVLANPTVVTMDGVKASINITDQVPTITQTSTITNGVQVITTNISTQNAGVIVELTPQIFNDGSVMLNIKPNVSQPIRTVTATNNGLTVSTVLLSTRSMDLSGVRVKDGRTLVIGGLVREVNTTDIRKFPGMDKLPIVSAMFRAVSVDNQDRTELVLMVTPHIIKEEAVSYFGNASGKSPSPYGQGGIQPASLPRHIGGGAAAIPAGKTAFPDAPEVSAGTAVKPEKTSALEAMDEILKDADH